MEMRKTKDRGKNKFTYHIHKFSVVYIYCVISRKMANSVVPPPHNVINDLDKLFLCV